ncbi:hypothetical protein EIN_036450 [Entamoeba invadens IP1]|uniref:CCHC-type domain-containing protein n=1 Tax=Entamoeba invadens IP1 TaxID=370355 RepID=A0A0A1TY03_ENTIV|nr:hypothetical protein EIN_036450 [Entamoeba invadens IP1]ELP86328.1 hypothetical protein EIN_036450 [Entamoeba invadens IP1]|eukprot:XP_004185674.1 hypothetical protein EIN_036450 [Entamoeba invadens IP1]
MEKKELSDLFKQYKPIYFEYETPDKNKFKAQKQFVLTFSNAEDSSKACDDVNGTFVDGKKVRVTFSNKHTKTAFIRNLPEDKTEDDVKKLFEKFNVTTVVMESPTFNDKLVDVKIGVKDEKTANRIINDFKEKEIGGKKIKFVVLPNYKGKKCFKCGKYGHKGKECPESLKSGMKGRKGKNRKEEDDDDESQEEKETKRGKGQIREKDKKEKVSKKMFDF